MARRELPLLVSQKEEIDRLYREGLEASEIAVKLRLMKRQVKYHLKVTAQLQD
jgi:DNA-binding NarL/FixJ family response regulator